ncbi:MAG: hypothetical protein Q4A69_01905 [Moraxella sp.]|nr:hypothetical protein [Moraxella sp.]
MKIQFKTTLVASLLLCSVHALANDAAKIALVKKTIASGDIGTYASPSLKQLSNKAYKLQFQIGDSDLGCDYFDNYFLGLGQDDANITNMKVTVLSNGLTRATFLNYGSKETVDFNISCQGKTCQINDVISYYEGKADPLTYKKYAEYIINRRQCPQ